MNPRGEADAGGRARSGSGELRPDQFRRDRLLVSNICRHDCDAVRTFQFDSAQGVANAPVWYFSNAY